MTQFEQDMSKHINYNGTDIPRGYYNLVMSIRDVSLFSKGIKPHRNWRLKDVKWYFGISGNTQKVLSELNHIKDLLTVEND
jgi:hypothetical protein